MVLLTSVVGFWLLLPPPPPRITNARPLTAGIEGLADAGWATDGTRLYFLVNRAPGTFASPTSVVYQVPVTGGEAAAISTALPGPHNQSICGYLASESALLMTGSPSMGPADTEKGLGLWSVPVPAGAPSRLGTFEAIDAAVSLDGQMLALSQLSSRLVLARRDGSLVREWSALPSQPLGLAWSPDGRRLRFQALGHDRRQPWVWEVSAQGGEPRALWRGEAGRWTPDGRYYVFHRAEEAEAHRDMYAVRERRFPRLSSLPAQRLTFGPVSFTNVGSSADGGRLFAWGTLGRGELLRFDLRLRRFEKYLDGASVYYVDASRDGQWLAWVSYPDGALWRSRSDGSDRLRLTGPGWQVHLPRWSPDGTALVFAGRTTGETLLSIFRVGREGGEPELLARSQTPSRLWDPCWLPDGRAVLYSYGSVWAPEYLGIYRLDLGTRAVTKLPGSERLQFPKCSPGGDILAVGTPTQGDTPGAYYAFFRDRGRWERLGFTDMAYPNWSRDGRCITGLNVVARRIERWSRVTGRVETVAELGDLPLLTWVGVPWMGLAPDGSPLVVRDRSTRDLYALDWEAP
jgi:Tol biopolymer transport system component